MTHTAVLLYGEDSLHSYTFRTELHPMLRYRTTDYCIMHEVCTDVAAKMGREKGRSRPMRIFCRDQPILAA